MRLPLFQIDAFARRPFEGNPAAVVPLESWLDDAILQAIALENNLSETAFLVSQGEAEEHRFHLRWFTPALEVALCGHATLASASWYLDRHPEADEVAFDTLSGRLTVRRSGHLFAMDFPSLPPGEALAPEPDQVEAMGSPPQQVFRVREVHGSAYQLWVFASADEIAALAPTFSALRANVIATAPGSPQSEYDFVSRFFAPQSGVDEDPVTGSAHCTLAPYWARRLGRNELSARQISARGGDLSCHLRGDRVVLTGSCVCFLEGEIHLPDTP